jgi:hypothetical protein
MGSEVNEEKGMNVLKGTVTFTVTVLPVTASGYHVVVTATEFAGAPHTNGVTKFVSEASLHGPNATAPWTMAYRTAT